MTLNSTQCVLVAIWIAIVPLPTVAATCTYSGDYEADERCRQLEEQERKLERQSNEMARMNAEMARMQREQALHKLESDPQFQQLQKDDPECAATLQVWQTLKLEPRGGGLIGLISSAKHSNRLQNAERQMYKACNLSDPECEEAKGKRANVPDGASDQKIQKLDQKVIKACSYLEDV